jgi:hypothetical protein
MTIKLRTQGLVIAIISALTFLIIGCCSSVFFVAIPAEDFRSEKQKLPLSGESKAHLMSFLRSGGDRNTMPDVVDLEAVRYDSLLVLLSDTAYLKVEILEVNARFRKWFSDEAVYGVIDARDESMDLLDRPISYPTGGRYWWVFYRKAQALTDVLVVRDMMREPQKGE